MNEQINDGGSAFPHNVDAIHHGTAGVSLRDYFAAKAMAAQIAASGGAWMDSVVCGQAYELADEMLKARQR